MAIVKVQRKTKDSVYRVRWKDEAGKWHSRTFDRKRDAEAWEAKVVLAKRRGDLDDLDAGQQRLEDFVEEWWQLEAEPGLRRRLASCTNICSTRTSCPAWAATSFGT